MPSRRISTSVGANSTVPNILAGEDIEFPGRPSSVEIAATAAAAGIEFEVQFGSDLVGQRMVVAVEAVADQGPILPDNIVISEVAAGEDRLVLRLINTTVAAIVVVVYIRVEPIV